LTIGPYGVLTPDQARGIASSTLAEVRAGRDPAQARSADRAAPTVIELTQRYEDEYLPSKKPSSQEHDRLALRLHILPRLGSKKLAEVTERDVSRLHRDMSQTPVMANRVLALLRNLFGLAQRWEVFDGPNPCIHVKRYREMQRNRFLSEDEFARFGEALAELELESPARWAALAAIRLLALTGARKNEVLRLRWDDIDVQRRLAWLADSKTGARPLRLEEPALELLSKLSRRGEWVFPSRRKRGSPLRDISKTFATVLERAKIEKLRVHDLRHSKASVGAELGFSLPMIGAMLGHARASTTERYAHLAADPVRSAEQRVQSRIADALSQRTRAHDPLSDGSETIAQ
jgi:integrase